MKTILTTLFATAIAAVATAQRPDEALIRVKYNFSHMTDTNKRQNFFKETMMVTAGKNASVFSSYDNALYAEETKAALEQQSREQVGVATPTFKMPPRKKATSRAAVYYYANEHKLFIQEQLGAMYLVERDADKIDWKITLETQQIEGINCKKATAHYRGRNWIVWFSEDLPFATGPWILVGLPGLIIQAHDDRKEVIFEFAGLEKIENKQKKSTKKIGEEHDMKGFLGSSESLTKNLIELPDKAIRATPEEIKKLREAMKKDPQGFIKTQMAAMGFGGLTPISTGQRTTPPPAEIMNNPIDKSKP